MKDGGLALGWGFVCVQSVPSVLRTLQLLTLGRRPPCERKLRCPFRLATCVPPALFSFGASFRIASRWEACRARSRARAWCSAVARESGPAQPPASESSQGVRASLPSVRLASSPSPWPLPCTFRCIWALFRSFCNSVSLMAPNG